jgi:hypothetical protein
MGKNLLNGISSGISSLSNMFKGKCANKLPQEVDVEDIEIEDPSNKENMETCRKTWTNSGQNLDEIDNETIRIIGILDNKCLYFDTKNSVMIDYDKK